MPEKAGPPRAGFFSLSTCHNNRIPTNVKLALTPKIYSANARHVKYKLKERIVLSDEIKKDDELKENMRRHVDELHKEEDGAKQAKSGNFSIFLFALVCACLVGTWWMSAEQQHRRNEDEPAHPHDGPR